MANKKAQISFNVLQFILRLFFLIVVTITIIIVVNSYLKTTFDVTTLETGITYNRIMFANDLIYYDSLSSRHYPGIITQNSLSSKEIFKSSMDYGPKKHIAARLDLGFENELITAYLNPGVQQGYDEWIVLAKTKIPGFGGATEKIFFVPNIIFISKDNEKKFGILNVSVVMRNK
jgi:hypothetical protein